MRALLVLLPATALLACLVVLIPTARADVEEAKALVERLQELRKAEDVGGLTAAIGQVPDVYKGIEDKSTRGKLRAELGKILRDKDMGDARLAAVTALVALEDPKLAWKELSKAMPDRKIEEAQPLDLAIVKAAGALAQSRAIKPLLELAEKAKDNKLAAAAIEALGNFGSLTSQRVTVLEELMSIAIKTRPGQSTTVQISQEARERWAMLGPVIVKAMNELTGQRVVSFEDWELLYRDNKRNLRALFIAGD
ncbi:MAG: hypothetical protein ACYTG6_06195 [Planctomycetota bacterium]|jgi:hypothetical protein